MFPVSFDAQGKVCTASPPGSRSREEAAGRLYPSSKISPLPIGATNRNQNMSLAVYAGMCVLRIVSRQPEDPTQASRSYFRARANRALAAARQATTEEERVRLLRTASLYELNAELERRMKSRKVALPQNPARSNAGTDCRHHDHGSAPSGLLNQFV